LFHHHFTESVTALRIFHGHLAIISSALSMTFHILSVPLDTRLLIASGNFESQIALAHFIATQVAKTVANGALKIQEAVSIAARIQ
jgi:hypothetical protein